MQLATRFNHANTRSVTARGPSDYLAEDQLRHSAPSIFAEAAHESRSSRYAYIPTIEVVRGLDREGFRPVFACEAKSRDDTRVGFTKHMLRFRIPSSITAAGGFFQETPELIVINSHDGSTSYQLLAGFFRFVCSNGMVCGDRFEDFRVRHNGNVVGEVIDAAYRVVDDFGQVIGATEQMKAIELKPAAQVAFGEAALALKYLNEDTGKVEAPITAEQLTRARRSEDTKPDLWHTFNRTQENLIQGGLHGSTRDANGRRRRATTRPVNGIDGNVKLNRALWTLAERMAELQGRPIAA